MGESLDAAELLRGTRVEVSPETFVVVSLRNEDWVRVLENPELSPRGDATYILMRDPHEVTLVLDETDWRTMRYAARNSKVESGFRLITLNIELDWNVVGFLALVTKILAEAGVAVGAVSAFSRDHLLIKQDDLGTALRALGPHVLELC